MAPAPKANRPTRPPTHQPTNATSDQSTAHQAFNAAVDDLLAHPDWSNWSTTLLPRYTYPPAEADPIISTYAAWRAEMVARKAAEAVARERKAAERAAAAVAAAAVAADALSAAAAAGAEALSEIERAEAAAAAAGGGGG